MGKVRAGKDFFLSSRGVEGGEGGGELTLDDTMIQTLNINY